MRDLRDQSFCQLASPNSCTLSLQPPDVKVLMVLDHSRILCMTTPNNETTKFCTQAIEVLASFLWRRHHMHSSCVPVMDEECTKFVFIILRLAKPKSKEIQLLTHLAVIDWLHNSHHLAVRQIVCSLLGLTWFFTANLVGFPVCMSIHFRCTSLSPSPRKSR